MFKDHVTNCVVAICPMTTVFTIKHVSRELKIAGWGSRKNNRWDQLQGCLTQVSGEALYYTPGRHNEFWDNMPSYQGSHAHDSSDQRKVGKVAGHWKQGMHEDGQGWPRG